ncbi:DUF6197 family protein [Streptomyces nanshensis]|uniref:Uncharacterized protein n=1 Tax=Streptomyces nanshensis TaxID=518642 RepID=A0A1E7KSL5_9ACTN|nr:hypothetical protein [Streptomyces nanshensis]OEV06897.1 hypothetical protein AN218_29800 [Streptomyces nanshensis]
MASDTVTTQAATGEHPDEQHLFEVAAKEMRPVYGTPDWIGLSGTPVTGAEVAEHLGFVIRLLEERRWVKQISEDTDAGALNTVNEQSTTANSIRAVIQWLRDQCLPQRDFTLREALGKTEDRDVYWVTMKAMQAVVTARNGNPCIDIDAWASRRARTLDEVRELAETTAEFARRYGPTAS